MHATSSLLPRLRLLLGLAAGLLSLAARAQTGVTIGATTAPDASAALDIISSSKGVLLPRVASAASISNPATGLIVYQTGGTAGFYFNTGTPAVPSWQQLATAAGAAVTAGNGLTKTGQNVALGGTLTGATTIGLGANNLLLTSSGGLVGVGTNNPSALLDVNGGLAIRGSGRISQQGAHLQWNRSNGGGETWLLNQQGGGAGGLAFGAADNVSTGANTITEWGRFDGSGKLGIGTSTPATTLDVRTSDNSATITVGKTDGTAGALYFGNSNHGLRRAYSNGNDVGLYTTSGNLYLSAAGSSSTSQLALLAGGNVGIGTGSPAQKLELVGPAAPTTAGTAPLLRLSRPTTANVKWPNVFDLALGSYTAGGNSLSRVDFNLGEGATGTADQTVLTLQGNGNVGIGTTSPGYKLEVNGTAFINSAYDLLLRDTNHGLGWYGGTKTWNGATPDGPVLYGYSGGLLGTKDGGSRSTLAWNKDGQVGIGTTAPAASALLELNTTSKGFLPPRLSQTQRDNLGSPAEGLVVYNTTTDRLNSWNGSAWTEYLAGTTAPPLAAVSYGYTGGVQTYTVPAGMTLLTVTAVGASGGMAGGNGILGGQGGRVTATISVTPGEVLNVYVGGKGGDYNYPATGAAGGFNGGGTAFARFAAGGGGATDIRRGADLADRLVVAGGGGGSSGIPQGGAGGNPGTAGNSYSGGGGGGGGGTQSAGGAPGASSWIAPGAGTLGQGGNAGTTGYSSGDNSTGAGGGGYYGGGGGGVSSNGSGNGGGGGSSWAAPNATNVSYQTGGNAGHGSLSIVASAQPAPSFDGANITNVPGAWLVSGADVYRAGGKVGIGTSSPGAALDVQSIGDVGDNNFAFYRNFNNTANTGYVSANGNDVSIRASGPVMAAEFYATSDRRLKTVLGLSDNARDLGLLTRLRITDYTMRDRAAFGDRAFKKVIAQEVEEVFPQAVSQRAGFLPDIYLLASAAPRAEGDSLLRLTLPAALPVAAAAGQRLKLVGPQGETLARLARSAAVGARTLLLRQAGALAGSEVFVFGLEHPDVRAVDYEALGMLHVSATQELARKVAALEADNAALRTRAAAADARHAQTMAQTTAALESLGQRLRALEAAGGGQARK